MKRPDPILATIAREHLLIPTLAIQKADSLDFHNIAVWQVEAALKAAFDAGAGATGNGGESQNSTQGNPVDAAPSIPLLVTKGTPLIPGKMYLRLYHGRNDPGQQMDDWGLDGPTFGPLSCYVHTYCRTFRIHGDCDTSEVWLDTHDDMIHWDGCFYGDMELFMAEAHDKA